MNVMAVICVCQVVGAEMPEVEDVDFDESLNVENFDPSKLAPFYQYWYLYPFYLPAVSPLRTPEATARANALKDAEIVNFRNVTQNEVRSARRQTFPGTLIPFNETATDFRLFLGNSLDALDVKWLRTNHIKAVLNLNKMSPAYFESSRAGFNEKFTAYSPLLLQPDQLRQWYAKALGDEQAMYLNLPINDDQSDLLPMLPRALKFIDEARARHLNILVHSHSGKDRSAAMVVAWLLRESPEDCLEAMIQKVDKARSPVRDPDWHVLTNSRLVTDLIQHCRESRPEEKCKLPPGPWQ